MKKILILVLVALGMVGCGTPAGDNVDKYVAGETYVQQKIDYEVLDLINEKRAIIQTCGGVSYPAVGPITIDENINQYPADWASTRTVDDVGHGDFHKRSEVIRADIDAKQGIYWRSIGENNAVGQKSAEQVVNDWMRSPGHCRNIMQPQWERVGVATVNIGSKYEPVLSFSTLFVGTRG